MRTCFYTENFENVIVKSRGAAMWLWTCGRNAYKARDTRVLPRIKKKLWITSWGDTLFIDDEKQLNQYDMC